MNFPTLKLEKRHWQKEQIVCGVDEVGRGSFAGPLVAAGVILKPNLSKKEIAELLSFGINDSKLVKKENRDLIIKLVQKHILYSTIQYLSVDIINEFGVGFANKLAFSKVAENILGHCEELKRRSNPNEIAALPSVARNDVFFLTDCFPIPEVKSSSQNNIIHGDQVSISIALASIIAKVERDSYMEKLGVKFPNYGFHLHKGYGTKLHREKLQTYGSSLHHRSKFIARYV